MEGVKAVRFSWYVMTALPFAFILGKEAGEGEGKGSAILWICNSSTAFWTHFVKEDRRGEAYGAVEFAGFSESHCWLYLSASKKQIGKACLPLTHFSL